MRYLGIDYGHKRIGLSYGDEVGIALPLKAAIHPTQEERLAYIKDIITNRKINELIIGYPYNMDDSISQKALEVDSFIIILNSFFNLPIHKVDERLTSLTAESFNKKPRDLRSHQAYRKSGQLDSQSATLILQDFLDSRIF